MNRIRQRLHEMGPAIVARNVLYAASAVFLAYIQYVAGWGGP